MPPISTASPAPSENVPCTSSTETAESATPQPSAAANATDEAAVYATGVGTALPLTRASTQAAVADQLADGGTALHSWATETDGVEVTVRCTRHVEIAFGWLFLGGQPLERTAVAGARAPTTP